MRHLGTGLWGRIFEWFPYIPRSEGVVVLVETRMVGFLNNNKNCVLESKEIAMSNWAREDVRPWDAAERLLELWLVGLFPIKKY